METNLNLTEENTRIGDVFNVSEERVEEMYQLVKPELTRIRLAMQGDGKEVVNGKDIIKIFTDAAITENELHYALFMAGMKTQHAEEKTKASARLRATSMLLSLLTQ